MFSRCKDAIEGGARLENLSWRLLSRNSKRHKPIPRAQKKHISPLLAPLSEPELSTDESGTSESGSDTGTYSEHSAAAQQGDTDVVLGAESNEQAFATLLGNIAWRIEPQPNALPEAVSFSPTQVSTAASTPRGSMTPVANWSRSRANSRSSVREIQRMHNTRTHSRTISRSSCDMPAVNTTTHELSEPAKVKQNEVPIEFVVAQPPNPPTQPAAPQPALERMDTSKGAEDVHVADAMLKKAEQEEKSKADTHAAQPDVAHPPETALPQGNRAGTPAAKVPVTPRSGTHTPSDPPAKMPAESKEVRIALPAALAALPSRRFAPAAADEPKLTRQRGSTTNVSRIRNRQQKSSDRLAGLRGAGRQNSRSGQAMALFGMTSCVEAPVQRRKKDKIKFTTGDDASDDDENAEDDWSDDETAEEEERRRAAEKAAEEKRQRDLAEELERHEMFKKRPIRSASLADLSVASSSAGLTAKKGHAHRASLSEEKGQLMPPRGLLSSIFGSSTALHALQEESPTHPGGSSRLPSARNARSERNACPGRTISFAALPAPAPVRGRNPSTPTVVRQTAPRATLDRSKSAIALPMLDKTSLRMTTSGHRERSMDRQSATSMTTTSSQNTDQSAPISQPSRSKSNTALLRLAAVASGRKSVDIGRSVSQVDISELAKDDDDGLSLGVKCSSPNNIEQERVPRLFAEAQPRRVSSRERQPRASEPVPLQSPRTTRQNMLLDELSESLRQNLLWERQSSARIFGVGRMYNPERRPGPGRVELEADEESFHHKGW